MKQIIEIELEVEAEKVNGIESLTGAVDLHATPEDILAKDMLFRVIDIKNDGNKFKVKLSKAQNIITASHYIKDNSVFELSVKSGKVSII